MRVTREFIFKNRTENGAWTYAQLDALGVKCPPRNGWIDRIEGKEISEEEAKLFIEGKNKFKKKRNNQPKYIQIEISTLETLKKKAEMFDKIQEAISPTKSGL